MSAAQEIRVLDAALAADGQWVELQRLVGTQLISIRCKCRAFVRAYAANELMPGYLTTDSKVVMSPSEIIRAGWPGPNSSATPTNQDRRVPRPPDRLIINGKARTLAEPAKPIYLDDQLIRLDMRVSG